MNSNTHRYQPPIVATIPPFEPCWYHCHGHQHLASPTSILKLQNSSRASTQKSPYESLVSLAKTPKVTSISLAPMWDFIASFITTNETLTLTLNSFLLSFHHQTLTTSYLSYQPTLNHHLLMPLLGNSSLTALENGKPSIPPDYENHLTAKPIPVATSGATSSPFHQPYCTTLSQSSPPLQYPT